MSLTNDAFVDALNYWQDRARQAEEKLKAIEASLKPVQASPHTPFVMWTKEQGFFYHTDGYYVRRQDYVALQDRAADREHRLSKILKDVYASLEDNFDVVDGDYGEPRPNRWMSVGNDLAFSCRKLGIDVTNR